MKPARAVVPSQGIQKMIISNMANVFRTLQRAVVGSKLGMSVGSNTLGNVPAAPMQTHAVMPDPKKRK
ncbi:hypothetical protein PABG_11690 [Paracoccidioides brasiliensis Pb03]|uniref:Uncharacterized protein n=2 Tax=Paracoccidioides brasiliensis TaxID=121759 RepID=A0A0A0HWM3_PARBD|nr:uncharacterized protein PADG_11297 [Paracoccidioides brasiliensis Pb18]KGM92476.1 hypothetical protein PADG_11297 [Paracoccidioides brasiliensis Pb18]KGY15385.1 hypothetical protein PABG_11690 [Paracoccidioides brasiliensis Pb03]ODH45481.1 hypothetical protein ACO22_00051 [Paracoccidioides brasiliensis]ODH49351.1 hypothetical protein GX48_04562 [Paracoccidioides brasiliensis]